MFNEGLDKGHMAIVIAQAASLTGIRRAVIAAKGASEGVDKDGGTLFTEKPMITISGIVATTYLGGILVFLVYTDQLVDIRFGLGSVGVNHHKSLIATAEEVDIHQ